MSHTTRAPRRRYRPPGLTKEQRERRRRVAFARATAPVLDRLRDAGVVGNGEVAAELNRRGVPSETGRPWLVQTVASLRRRLAVMAAPPDAFRAAAPPRDAREG